MGLDITIWVNNPEEVHAEDSDKFFYQHSLSRNFCNLIQYLFYSDKSNTALEQIGKITNVDLQPIYEMEQYCDEDCVRENLFHIETESEKQEFINRVVKDNARIENNIDRVLKLVTELIEKLNGIDNLPSKLQTVHFDSTFSDYYFGDFTTDKGDGYIGNNFGQDLRNFKRFVEYAKEIGTKTVYFVYG